jgi:Cu+-exporting ATPase
MTLELREPRGVDAGEQEKAELAEMTRRFWISAALAAPVAVLGMTTLVSQPASDRVQLVLTTPVMWVGGLVFARFWRSLLDRSPNMFTLTGLGIGAAYLYRVVAVLAPGVFPASIREGGQARPPVYFEVAAIIMALVLLGQVLELRARSSTNAAIRSLLQLAPKTARRIRADGAEEDVSLAEVLVGDRLRIRPGEKVPAPGRACIGGAHQRRRVLAYRDCHRAEDVLFAAKLNRDVIARAAASDRVQPQRGTPARRDLGADAGRC